MPDKNEPDEQPTELIVKKSGDVVVKAPVYDKPIISGVDQHVVLSQEDIDARNS